MHDIWLETARWVSWSNWHLMRTLNEHEISKDREEMKEILGREDRINTDTDTDKENSHNT